MIGIFNQKNVAELSYYGLHALQHRGQESAGIVTSDGHRMHIHKGEGLVRNVFSQMEMDRLKGAHAIGHVNYASIAESEALNVQPFLFKSAGGELAICHNGNIVNSKEIQAFLEREGSIFQTNSNGELLAHLLKRTRGDMMSRLKEALNYMEGSFSFLVMEPDALYVAIDKDGMRPMSIGEFTNGGYVVAAETCAFDAVGAKYVRDVLPGEVLRIGAAGITTDNYAKLTRHLMCSMEYIYFARPDSDIEEINVYESRKRCGAVLAKESPAPTADIVIGVPDSGLSAAIGYAEAAGLPFETGMVKNRYIGRTFIEPTQELREQGVKMKLSVIAKVVQGRSVVLVDDSIVRGTTSRNLITMLKNAGAKEVHMRIAAPEIKHPCFYGVDYSSYEELISAKHTTEEIRERIGADSLGFISVSGLMKGVGRAEKFGKKCGHCTACFTGEYATHLYNDEVTT
ncbi:MAG: amidophosphoribosyltransferase [Turicibacter sp.]|nr:amidophosphoribosyltransferase [Turicibacter sp.]